jgi:thioredoxin-related protein
LSFDSEEDNVLRYKKLLLSVKETCRYLDSLKKESQIEWRFKNQELLKNNFLTMIASKYSREKIKGLLENLANKIN